MNALKSFTEKSITRVAAAVLVLGLGACSDDISVSGSTSLAGSIANDVNGLVGEVSAGADAGIVGDSNADAGASLDAGTDVAEDIALAPDAEQKPDTESDILVPIEDVAPDAQEDVQPDIQADIQPDEIAEDAASNDTDTAAGNDIPLSSDITAVADTLVTKPVFCAQTITDECLKQFQSVMCADACATTDIQVENDIQAKVDEFIMGFDKAVSALGQAPKSSIWIGKDYEIVDGNVTWRVTIKNALMDTLHIEYTLQKTEDNGNSQKLTWLVKNLTLEPERLELRTDTQTPCNTIGYETVDIQPSNQPSVKKDLTAKLEGVSVADEDCLNFDNVTYNIENVCTDANKSVFTGENCTTSNDSYNNGTQIDWFSADWENDSQASKAAYKAFLIKGLNQFHVVLQKQDMDIIKN